MSYLKDIKNLFFNIIKNLSIKNLYKTVCVIDRVSIGIIMLLISISSFELISSLGILEIRMCKHMFLFQKHILFIGLFFLGILMLGSQNKETNIIISAVVGAFAIVLCILLLLFGGKINGAKRWLNFLGFSIQPSVFLKNTISIFTPFIFNKLTYHLLFVCFISLIVLLQPDLGMTLLILSISITGIIIIYEDLEKYLWLIVPFLIVIVIFLLLKGNYILIRINKFFTNEGLYQSNIALFSMKKTSFFGSSNIPIIPDSHCDFIFASITSHYGLISGLGIIFLFLLFFVHNMEQIKNLPFSDRIIVYGILSQISYQSIFHFGSNLSFIPPKGVSCPFLSFGGSEILATTIGIGTLLSITKRR